MRHLVQAVKQSIVDKNWYSALSLALALPDIVARLEDPTKKTKESYIAWCDTYLVQKYTVTYTDGTRREFLHGNDCYALRCAFLHEGDFDITGQKARHLLHNFKFVMPSSGIRHNNLYDFTERSLELQVDQFCGDICSAVEEWLAKTASDNRISAAMNDLLTIDFS